MKKIIIVLIVLFTVSTTVSAQITTVTSKKEEQKTMYSCPMHPKEMSMKKGACSKCGMDLVKTKTSKRSTTVKGSQARTTVKTKYICKMDGATAEKAGKCPKCGMAMTPKENDEKEDNHNH
jgi:hypothetical protein